MARILNSDEIKIKCHIGQGAEACRFLVMSPGNFECGYLNEDLCVAIEFRASRMKAKSGPCSDPYDATSEATL